MAYGDSGAEEMDAALSQERATMWAYRATEEAECNKPLRVEVERLQRENAAAHLEADRIGREYAVLGSERDRLKAKLAAAEGDTKRLNGRIAALNGDLERARGVIERQALAINHAIQNTLGCAAIDAAKPEVKE